MMIDISPALVIAIVVVVYLLACLKVLNEYERAVVFRLGKLLPVDEDHTIVRLLHAGERLAFVDLRPADAYRAGHLPGARSVPLAELRSRHGEIPRDALVVVYGDASTAEAGAAWRFLRSVGVPRAFVLEGGLAGGRGGGCSIEDEAQEGLRAPSNPLTDC